METEKNLKKNHHRHRHRRHHHPRKKIYGTMMNKPQNLQQYRSR